MKTIEERAKAIMADLVTKIKDWPDDAYTLVGNGLRELAEDCAKIGDKHEAEEQGKADECNRNGKGLSQMGHVYAAVEAKTIAEDIRLSFGLIEAKPVQEEPTK